MTGGSKTRIGCIVGATASGKTAASVEAALLIGAEIVSCDSISVYRGLNIGSARPTQEEMRGVKHHLIGCVDVRDTTFSVAEFRNRACAVIEEIVLRGRFPLVVGGTGLYVNALLSPFEFASSPPNVPLRVELEQKEVEQKGVLHEMLKKADPIAANRLHPNDIKRIIRALEVCAEGRRLSEENGDFEAASMQESCFDPVIVGLTMPRELLYARIDRRVDEMLASGLEQEVRGLFDSGCDLDLPAMNGIGYKQLVRYFKGEYDMKQAVELIKRDSRRLAKRQLTWFRRDKRIIWLDITHYSSPKELAKEVVKLFDRD